MDAVRKFNGAKYDCLLFDLDDTLYPLSSGINLACRKNIIDYMLQRLHMNEDEVPRLCLELYRKYGTTMAGLKAIGYDFDNDEFHEFVHGKLPYETLKPDPVLRNLLLSMPQRKIIFTNSDKAHTVKVLNRLGLEDCFDGIICFETLNQQTLQKYDHENVIKQEGASNRRHPRLILSKPSVDAIKAAIDIADIDPSRTLFFDDSTRNIVSGKAAGLHTVIVESSVLVPGADYALSSIHNIREALPEIWEGCGGGHNGTSTDQQLGQILPPAPAVQTVVRA